jgi:hypothetical protein
MYYAHQMARFFAALTMTELVRVTLSGSEGSRRCTGYARFFASLRMTYERLLRFFTSDKRQ